MKFNQIAIAAAMLAAAAAQAQTAPGMTAAETALVTAGTSQTLFVAGASAVQKGFEAMITNLLYGTSAQVTDPATGVVTTTYTPPIYFVDDATKALNSGNYVAVAGYLKSASGTWAKDSAVIVKYRVAGGSINGVNYVVRTTTPITTLNVTTACGLDATGLLTVGAGTAAHPYVCGTTTGTPDVGVSDVAPKYFTAPYNVEGETPETQLTALELGKLTIKPLYAQAFGIPVTNTVPASTVFNRATVTAIMTGGISTWDKVSTDGTDNANPLNAGAGNIVICRRSPGSGSQAVMNIWSAGIPCSTNAAKTLDRTSNSAGVFDAVANTYTAANAAAGTTIVIENNASGDVRSCLDAAVNGGTYKTKDRSGVNSVTVDFGTGGYKAIGVLSLDSIGSALQSTTVGAAGQWGFRSLNGAGVMTGVGLSTSTGPAMTGSGVFPTIADLRTGNWDMQGWTTMQYLKTLAAPKVAFANALLAEAQSVTTMQAAKELKWTAGIIPNGSNASTQTLNVTFPVASTGPNMCAPLSRQY